MGRSLLLLLVLAPACSFRLPADSARGEEPDAATPSPDAAPDAGNCSVITMAPPIDDVEITPQFPDQTIERSPVHRIRSLSGGQTALLLRFPVTAEQIAASDRGLLHVSYPVSSALCTGTDACDSCASLESAGQIEVSWVTSDWTGNQVCWRGPRDGQDWVSPGLGGVNERSAAVASADSVVGGSEIVRLDDAALDKAAQWVQPHPSGGSEVLGAILEVSTDTAVVVSAIDNDEGCDEGAASFPPVRLVLESCE